MAHIVYDRRWKGKPISLFFIIKTTMKKKVITYGVYGMMEYQSVIKMGKCTMKVNFSDGSVNSFGQNPARFTTDNFMIQHAIEHSYDFRRGLIKIVNAHELDEDVQILHNAAPCELEDSTPPVDERVHGSETTVETLDGDNIVPDESVVRAAEASEKTGEAADSSADATPTEVEFGTNDEAKAYLESTFGVQRSKLRTRADIEKAGMQYGVKIYFVSE